MYKVINNKLRIGKSYQLYAEIDISVLTDGDPLMVIDATDDVRVVSSPGFYKYDATTASIIFLGDSSIMLPGYLGYMFFNQVTKTLDVINESGLVSTETTPFENYGLTKPIVYGVVIGAPNSTQTLYAGNSMSTLTADASEVPVDYLWTKDGVEFARGSTASITLPEEGETVEILVYAIDHLFNASEPFVVTLTGDVNYTGNGKLISPFTHTFPETVEIGERGTFFIDPGTNDDGDPQELLFIGNNVIEVDVNNSVAKREIHYTISSTVEELSTKAVLTVGIRDPQTNQVEWRNLTARISPSVSVGALSDLGITITGMDEIWYVGQNEEVVVTLSDPDDYTITATPNTGDLSMIDAVGTLYSSGETIPVRVASNNLPIAGIVFEITHILGKVTTTTVTVPVEDPPAIGTNGVTIDLDHAILGIGSTSFTFTEPTDGIAPYTYVWTTPVVPNGMISTVPDSTYNYPDSDGFVVAGENYGRHYPISITSVSGTTVNIDVSGSPAFSGTTANLMLEITDSVGSRVLKTFTVASLTDHQTPVVAADFVLTATLPYKAIGAPDFYITGTYAPIVRNGISYTPKTYIRSALRCSTDGATAYYQPPTSSVLVALETVAVGYEGDYQIAFWPNMGNFAFDYLWTNDSRSGPYGATFTVSDVVINDIDESDLMANRMTQNTSPAMISWSSNHVLADDYVLAVDENGSRSIHVVDNMAKTGVPRDTDFQTSNIPRVCSPLKAPTGYDLWVLGDVMRFQLSGLIRDEPILDTYPTNPAAFESPFWYQGSQYSYEYRVENIQLLNSSGAIVTTYRPTNLLLGQARPAVYSTSGGDMDIHGNWVTLRGLPQDGTFYTLKITTGYLVRDSQGNLVDQTQIANDRGVFDSVLDSSGSTYLLRETEKSTYFDFRSYSSGTDYETQDILSEYRYISSSSGAPITLPEIDALRDKSNLTLTLHESDDTNFQTPVATIPVEIGYHYPQLTAVEISDPLSGNPEIAIASSIQDGENTQVPSGSVGSEASVSINQLAVRSASSSGDLSITETDYYTWDFGDVHPGNVLEIKLLARDCPWMEDVGWVDFSDVSTTVTGNTSNGESTRVSGKEFLTSDEAGLYPVKTVQFRENEADMNTFYWRIPTHGTLGSQLLFFRWGNPNRIYRAAFTVNIVESFAEAVFSYVYTSSRLTGLGRNDLALFDFSTLYSAAGYPVTVKVMSFSGSNDMHLNNGTLGVTEWSAADALNPGILIDAGPTYGTGTMVVRLSATGSGGQFLDITVPTEVV